MTTRPLVAGVAAVLALGSAGAAAAQSVDVSAVASSGSRQFFVEDLTGVPLTALNLGTGAQGLPFQARVTDTDFAGAKRGFTASAEMTKLYKAKADGTPDYSAPSVGSDKVSVGYSAVPTIDGVSLGALPKISISGLLPTCSELPALLGPNSPLTSVTTTTLAGVTTTALAPVNALLGGLPLTNAAKPLCDALGGPTATATAALPIETVDGVVITLQEKVLTPVLNQVGGLPVTVAGSTETGAFTHPSFLGDGANDPSPGAELPTPRTLLGGSSGDGFSLQNLLSPVLDLVPLFPANPALPVSTTNPGVTDVASVVAALQGSTDTVVQQVGSALAGLSAVDQTGVLAGLDPTAAGGPIAALVESVLTKISGTYRSFPKLTADLSGAPAGSYTGTMTVTFVQK